MRIKPCPICGESYWIKEDVIRGYEPYKYIRIICSNPECPLHRLPISSSTLNSSNEETKQIVIDNWNEQYDKIRKLINESEEL